MQKSKKVRKGFEELTNLEYTQLQMFRKLKEYTRLKNNELAFEKGYSKYDVLWNIYNQQKDTYFKRQDYIMVSVVYNRMYELLRKEKRYDKALEFMICCLYTRIYDNYLYERHLLKFMKELNSLLRKNKIDIKNFEQRQDFIVKEIKSIVQKYLPCLYNEEKVTILEEKINKFLNT